MKSWPELMLDLHNSQTWLEWEIDKMCHICKRTGIRECDPHEAEIKCMICGFCSKEDERQKREEETK